jgi:hypothetical protein
MKNLALLKMSVIGLLTSCVAINSNTNPQITAEKAVIKIGETAVITMTAPTRAVTWNPDATFQFNNTGFIYSPNPNQPAMKADGTINFLAAPYVIDSATGIALNSPTSIFPIAPQLEVVAPLTGNDNVPARMATVQDGDLSKVTFTVKGKSVGTATIRGGFLSHSPVQPENKFHRTPFVPLYDGSVSIEVIP